MNLKERIVEISKKHKLAHVGSNLSAVGIIDEIYKKKKPQDKFILSCGHSGVALYVVLEKYEGLDPEKALADHGIHSTRCAECNIHCSTGSLGNGLPIALGMALADRKRKVYCVISDGECMEGSIWESLRLKTKFQVDNLIVYVNANGWGGLDKIDLYALWNKLKGFDQNIQIEYTNSKPYLEGLEAHYTIL